MPIRCIVIVVLLTCAPRAARADFPKISISDRTVDPLVVADKPWEDFCLNYCQVLREGSTWHLWYGSYDHTYTADSTGFLCYARSDDGVHWEKPSLGLLDYHGSKDNNIIFRNTHGHSFFIDSAVTGNELFKPVYAKPPKTGGFHVFGATSPDGIHWTEIEKPILKHDSDTQTVCFRDGEIYRLYLRMWLKNNSLRAVGYCESNTFGDFPKPRTILAPDDQDPPNLHFYTSAATKLADHLYILFPGGFYTGEDVIRPHYALGMDGIHFTRPQRTPILDLGKGFDSMGLYVSPGPVPADKSNQFWFYYLGASVGHDRNRPENTHNQAGIGRFLVTLGK
jgi:hypothetical protein